ncbi:MAG: hypothetical protein ACRETC_07830 [Gammaproteobacteria bacterium]
MTNPLLRGRRRDWQKDLDRAWRRCKASQTGLERDALDVLRSDLRQHIQGWTALDRDEGRLQARNALMDGTERMLLQRTLRGLEPETRVCVASRLPEFKHLSKDLDRYLTAEKLRLNVMRTWMGFYYGDRARGDWYAVYCEAAEMRLDSISRDFERIAGLPVYKVEDNRDAAIRGINASLRLRLLQMPPGAKVGRRSLRTRWQQLTNRTNEVNEHNG